MESRVMSCVKYILMRQAHKYILPKLRRSGTLRNCGQGKSIYVSGSCKVYTSLRTQNRKNYG